MVRIGLRGAEMAVRITGTGAKHLAVLIYAALKEQKKTAGRTRLVNMLKTEKELSVFTVKNSDLKVFAREAKKYGVLYCALREKKPLEEGMVDIMVKQEDSAKISRIVERFKFATVDIASVTSEIEKSREEKSNTQDVPDRDAVAADKEVAPSEKEADLKPVQKESSEPENPSHAKPQKSPRSETISRIKGISERESSEVSRKSVRKAIAEIRQERKGKGGAAPIKERAETDIASNVTPKIPQRNSEGRPR